MLNAARAHGKPMMVIAITIPAITQPKAIHRPPKMIHNRFSTRDRADMGLPEEVAPITTIFGIGDVDTACSLRQLPARIFKAGRPGRCRGLAPLGNRRSRTMVIAPTLQRCGTDP